MEKRRHKRHSTKRERGHVSVAIDCPFCGTSVRTYLWSLAGTGKLCPTCGAKHNMYGFTMPALPGSRLAKKYARRLAEVQDRRGEG